MKRIREIRHAALASIDGHWGWAILPCLIYGAISTVITMPMTICSIAQNPLLNGGSFRPSVGLSLAQIGFSSFASVAGIFLTNVLLVGVVYSLNLLYKGDVKTVPNMFRYSFGDKRYWHNVGGMFLTGLFTFLWLLLFIVPGIIKGLAYSLTPYILVDNPELGPDAARRRSVQMMRGYKWKMFVLDLSFIGWFLLCLLSLGIGFIWLEPYINTSHAAFYQEVLADWNAKHEA